MASNAANGTDSPAAGDPGPLEICRMGGAAGSAAESLTKRPSSGYRLTTRSVYARHKSRRIGERKADGWLLVPRRQERRVDAFEKRRQRFLPDTERRHERNTHLRQDVHQKAAGRC